MTRPDVIDTAGEVVEPRALPARRVGQPELALVATLLRYANHLPGCAPAGASSCSCGLSRAVAAAVGLGCPAPSITPPAPVPNPAHDVEAALLGGAIGGLLGTLLRKATPREDLPADSPPRARGARRPDGPVDSAGERARALVRKRRGR